MLSQWVQDGERFDWQATMSDGIVKCHERRPRLQAQPLVIYPELIYRIYRHDKLVEQVTHPLIMRCYYPEQFSRLITDRGFQVTDRWGGYNSEPYDTGTELVVEFINRQQAGTQERGSASRR